MPEFRREAKKKMEALTPEIKTAIEQRFADTSSLTNDIVSKMGRDIPFPQALVEAVRDRDPELALEIEKSLSKEEPLVESKPEQAVETAVAAEAGVSPMGPAAKVSAGVTVGEEFTLELEAGAIKTSEGVDFAASAWLSGDVVFGGIYREPLKEVQVAGVIGVYAEVAPRLSVGGGVEAGLDIEGGRYVTFYPSVSYEGERFSLEVSPQITVMPEMALGVEASFGYEIAEGLSVRASFYSYDLRSPTVTAMAGAKLTF
jgi:hypothetical protein